MPYKENPALSTYLFSSGLSSGFVCLTVSLFTFVPSCAFPWRKLFNLCEVWLWACPMLVLRMFSAEPCAPWDREGHPIIVRYLPLPPLFLDHFCIQHISVHSTAHALWLIRICVDFVLSSWTCLPVQFTSVGKPQGPQWCVNFLGLKTTIIWEFSSHPKKKRIEHRNCKLIFKLNAELTKIYLTH